MPIGRIVRMENGLMNTSLMKRLTASNSSTMIAQIALWSNLTKDAVNCYYYVTQSLNNKKIPEDKRKFVAGLDLSNGILNVISQFILGNAVIDWSDKFFDKHIAPKFYAEKALEKAKEAPIKYSTIEALTDAIKQNKGIAKTGMKVIATVAATQIICKRIIVPLFATPMASYFRKEFEKRDKKNGGINAQPPQDTVSFENSSSKKDDDIKTNVKISNMPECFQSFVK